MRPILFEPVKSPYLVSYDGSFEVASSPTAPPKKEADEEKLEERLAEAVARIAKLQKVLYADDRHAVLLVFQAMDAAGKDGTIRAVLTGVNPTGVQVFSFKAPSAEELDHDFLWRLWRCLPERGRIGVWNRSHYEETLVVRVHREIVDRQQLPRVPEGGDLWQERFDSIRDMERHLARNGTVILKFWLNVSKDEQKRRFRARIEDSDASWKFSARDVGERQHWDSYMSAYEEALRETSRPWAPWYAIPADDKPFMRACVAKIVAGTLKSLPMRYPEVAALERSEMKKLEDALSRGDL